MRLKLYRAASTAEAMARVRAELGADALILGTRRVRDGVEVTAALEPEDSFAPLPDPERQRAFDYHAVPPILRDKLQNGPLPAALAAALPFGVLPLDPGERPLLFAGPPGAGKTVTVARLATRLVMAGAAPLVITADGSRAGATEQLAAFTRLLGLSLIVACHPVTLARALARRRDDVPVLIDGPGSDPFDPAQRDALLALSGTANAEMALVLPAGLDTAEAAEQASAYAETGAALLVATRLDLARRVGGVIAAAAAGPLALTEAGIGPGAADGLIPLSPDFLAARLMQTGTPRT
jgi:flagellar biosynthesis protein FlhF